jgi:hypothetical protein
MEACLSAHFVSRTLRALGHKPRIIPAKALTARISRFLLPAGLKRLWRSLRGKSTRRWE